MQNSVDEKQVKKQIKTGGVISFFSIAVEILLGLIYMPWILRVLGDSDYGLYTLANSFIALFLVDFGMSAAVSRFVSNFRAEGKQEAINSFTGIAVKFYIIICTVIAAALTVVYFNIPAIYKKLTADEIHTYKYIFVIVAVFVVGSFPGNICNGILNAYEKYVPLKSTELINRCGTVVLTVIALMCNGGIIALVLIKGVCNFTAFIVKIFLVRKKTPVRISFAPNENVSFKDMFSFSAWTTVNTFAQQMIFNVIPTILGMVANTFAITVYGFANSIEGYVYTITQAINGMFMPKISRTVVGEKDAAKTLPLMIKVGRVNHSIITLLLIGLTVLGKEFVRLWVGEKYAVLYYCILALSFPYFISASQQIAATSIIVFNKVKYSAIICLSAGVVNMLCAYFLAGRFGVLGVCITTGILFVCRSIASNIVYDKVLQIDVKTFFKECHLKMAPAALISLLLSYLFCLIPLSADGLLGWFYFTVKAAGVTIIYFAVMYFLGWNDFEKELLRSFLPKIRIGGRK